MAYNNYFPQNYQQFPQAYPQQTIQQNVPQNNGGVNWVQGIEGAKAFPLSAGQSALLMDSESDCFYLKSADQMGMPSMRIFDYTERTNGVSGAKNADLTGFISKDELLPYATKEDLNRAILDLEKKLRKEGKKHE